MQYMESHADSLDFSPREGNYGFVVVQVMEGDLSRTWELVTRVCELGTTHDAFAGHILSSIVMFCYGVVPGANSPDPSEFVLALHAQFGSNIRVVHGTFHGLFGNMGSEPRWSFGPVFPDTTRIFSELIALEFGQGKELKLT